MFVDYVTPCSQPISLYYRWLRVLSSSWHSVMRCDSLGLAPATHGVHAMEAARMALYQKISDPYEAVSSIGRRGGWISLLVPLIWSASPASRICC